MTQAARPVLAKKRGFYGQFIRREFFDQIGGPLINFAEFEIGIFDLGQMNGTHGLQSY